jgi:transposase
MRDRHDLTDEEWALLEPLLPDRTPRRGGRWMDHRSLIDGVLWRTRVGAPWRDMPAEYGHWKTIYNRHRAWSASGMRGRILARLQAGADAQAVDEQGRWSVSIDSTIARAHQHAAGARRAPAADLTADLTGDLTADLTADLSGDPSGHVAGDVADDVAACVTGG